MRTGTNLLIAFKHASRQLEIMNAARFPAKEQAARERVRLTP
jgi:hypothetical protein